MDINYLASIIIKTMNNDATLLLKARGLAQYMLLCKKLSIDFCERIISAPNAIQILTQLFKTSSSYLGSQPFSVGIELNCYLSSSNVQKSLDVKHIDEKSSKISTNQNDNVIKPNINIDLLYNHPTKIWIRFYCRNQKYIAIVDTKFKYHIYEIAPNVYEAYGGKDIADAFIAMNELETKYNADLIFCSELDIFMRDKKNTEKMHANMLLGLSNYIKFMWCYTLNRIIFDVSSDEDVKLLHCYMTYGLLFFGLETFKTKNLSTMSTTTHNPIIVCTGERPKIALSKFDKSTIYNNEGSRALQSLDQSSDYGTTSNFIEVISDIDLDVSVLNNII